MNLVDSQFDEAVQSLFLLSSTLPKISFKSSTKRENLKITLSNTSAVFKRPLDTPSPDLKASLYENKGMMMGFISEDNILPLYEDLVPFNYKLYKLISTNTISLCNFNGIENIDWYNLNLLTDVSSKK